MTDKRVLQRNAHKVMKSFYCSGVGSLVSRKNIFAAILIFGVLLGGVFVLAPQALAADTGWKAPTANIANNPNGSNPDQWSNPSNAYSDGGGFASDNEGERHRYYNFGFIVPTGSIIDGIEAKVDAWSSDGSGCQLGVDLSWDGGSNSSSWSNQKTQNLSGSESTHSLGSGSDKWGSHGWVDSDFSDTNFRARVQDVDPGSSCENDATTKLDWIQLKVIYHAPVTHTIIASANTGGTIIPSSTVVVNDGTNQTFNITPDTGYIVSDVLVDSGSLGRVNGYTFDNVVADHTITASFDGGWKEPSFFADEHSVGQPQKAYSSNNEYAVFNSSDDEIEYKGFGFNIPSSSVINGIEVAIEGNRTSERTLNLSLSWDGGDHFTTSKNFGGSFSGSDITGIVGSATSTWGRTWVGGNFENFRIKVDATSGGGDINIDQIQVKIYYTLVPQGSISGQKFSDTNLDWAKSQGEPGLLGWTVVLYDSTNYPWISVAETTTDQSGNYSFSNLPDGTYTVCEVSQNGWYQVFPTQGPSCSQENTRGHSITVTNGNAVVNKDFGNVQAGHLKVNKVTNPTDTQTQFSITAHSDGGWTDTKTITGGSSVTWDVYPRVYNVTEDAITDWSVTSNNCSGLQIGADQTVECTIVNTYVEVGPQIPVYGGDSACPQGTTPTLLNTYTISATDTDGESFTLISGIDYLFKAFGTYVPTSMQNWYADAGFSTQDSWGTHATQYGIYGTGSDYGAHALLADLGNGVGIMDWGTYNNDHVYQKHFVASSSNAQVLIGDRYGNWFNTDWQNQAGMSDNQGALTLEVYQCQAPEPCNDVVVASDTNDDVYNTEGGFLNKALTVSWLHPAWTAVIDTANWIWQSDPVTYPNQEEIYVFEKSFNVVGVPSVSSLKIAADNSYKVWINNTFVGEDATEQNYNLAGQDQLDVSQYIQSGTNVIKFEVKNHFLSANSTAQENPAGILYRLDIQRSSCTPPPQPTVGSISGMKFNDLDKDGQKVEGENGLADWKIIAHGQDPLDTFNVEPKDESTIGTSILEQGKTYLVKVTGTYDAGDSITADAKYSFREGSSNMWTDLVSMYEPPVYSSVLLDLQIAGNTPGTWVTPEWGSYTPSHIYWASVVGNGAPLQMRIDDIYYPNDSGSLHVEIYNGYLATTDQSGNYSFAQMSFGTYVIEEQFKNDWVQSYPVEPKSYTINLNTETSTFIGKDFGNYDLMIQIGTPQANPGSGTYTTSQQVVLTATGPEGTQIYYTLDGSIPTCWSTHYTNPIGVASLTTIKAIACDFNGHISDVGSYEYRIEYTPGGGSTIGGVGFQVFGGSVLGESTSTEGISTTTPTSTIPQGEVLGESTCAEYLPNLLWYKKSNDSSEVIKLQTFLNDTESASLPLTGFFGTLTRNQVRALQLKYAEQILKPWEAFGYTGDGAASGNVYKMTRWFINNKMCPALNFPLPQLP